MTLTAELSLYPLQNEYIAVIQAFIHNLNQHSDLLVVTNAMSTQIRGEHDAVMAAVSQTLKASGEAFGAQMLVCKFYPGTLDIS